MLEILAAPFATCLVLAAIHCYLGLHVLMREVIFVDLSLAQIAALGVAVGTLLGAEPHTTGSYLYALAFTVLGALLFAVSRLRDRTLPQEAVIGIVYAVSAALMFMILSHSAADRDEIDHMMLGQLLVVGWDELGVAAVVYGSVALLHAACRRPFFRISSGAEGMSRGRVRLWDFLFYVTFGVVVSNSVQMAGVLVVFSFLIVPAACASLFWTGVRPRLLAGWAFGVTGSVLGVGASAWLDFPLGASVVAALGFLFACCTVLSALRRRR